MNKQHKQRRFTFYLFNQRNSEHRLVNRVFSFVNRSGG